MINGNDRWSKGFIKQRGSLRLNFCGKVAGLFIPSPIIHNACSPV